MKILKLTVKQPWFSLMISGEKTIEVRNPIDWIKSRILNKDYDLIQITNDYGKSRPNFIAKYEGFGSDYDVIYTFSDGNKLNVNPEQYVIFIGEIISKTNIK